MDYAIVINGIVDNVAVWDGVTEWRPEGEVVLIAEGVAAGIGWGYDGENFIPPAE